MKLILAFNLVIMVVWCKYSKHRHHLRSRNRQNQNIEQSDQQETGHEDTRFKKIFIKENTKYAPIHNGWFAKSRFVKEKQQQESTGDGVSKNFQERNMQLMPGNVMGSLFGWQKQLTNMNQKLDRRLRSQNMAK